MGDINVGSMKSVDQVRNNEEDSDGDSGNTVNSLTNSKHSDDFTFPKNTATVEQVSSKNDDGQQIPEMVTFDQYNKNIEDFEMPSNMEDIEQIAISLDEDNKMSFENKKKPKITELEIENKDSKIVSENEEGKYVIRTAFESRTNGKHTFRFFCLVDESIKEEYNQDVNDAFNYGVNADESKKGQLNLSNLKKLNESDKNLNDAYKNKEGLSAYAGFLIERKDSKNKLTSLAGVTETLEITTRNLNSKNAIRILLSSGEFLELHLDEHGNFNGEAIPLTNFGSNIPKIYNLEEADTDLVYNRYDDVMGDLEKIKSFTVNGEDIKEKVLKSIQGQIELNKNYYSSGMSKKSTEQVQENKEDDQKKQEKKEKKDLPLSGINIDLLGTEPTKFKKSDQTKGHMNNLSLS